MASLDIQYMTTVGDTKEKRKKDKRRGKECLREEEKNIKRRKETYIEQFQL